MGGGGNLMKILRKLAAMGLAGAMIFLCAGCANSDNSGDSSNTESEITSETTTEDDGIAVGDHIILGTYK